MPRKLQFRWTGAFWITREFKGSYQLVKLVGELLEKWVNGFQLKPYKGPMPVNSFMEPEERRDQTNGEEEVTNKEVDTNNAKYIAQPQPRLRSFRLDSNTEKWDGNKYTYIHRQ